MSCSTLSVSSEWESQGDSVEGDSVEGDSVEPGATDKKEIETDRYQKMVSLKTLH